MNGSRRSGWATYYCCTRGYGNAQVVALAGGRYVPKGNKIKKWAYVCVIDANPFRDGKQKGICHLFPAVDACGCGPRRGKPTIVDLSLSARDRLGLNKAYGYYWVSVTIKTEK